MQNPIHPCAGFRRVASCALRFALHGTGTVLNCTGVALVCAGVALQACGKKIKSFASAHPHDSSAPTDHATTQPA